MISIFINHVPNRSKPFINIGLKSVLLHSLHAHIPMMWCLSEYVHWFGFIFVENTSLFSNIIYTFWSTISFWISCFENMFDSVEMQDIDAGEWNWSLSVKSLVGRGQGLDKM